MRGAEAASCLYWPLLEGSSGVPRDGTICEHVTVDEYQNILENSMHRTTPEQNGGQLTLLAKRQTDQVLTSSLTST